MQKPDYDAELQTWEGTLAGQVNNFYSKIINRDVDKPGYSSRLRGRHFFLKKRKGYKKIKFFNDADIYAQYNNWNVTDIQEVNDSTCKTNNCKRYFFLENKSATKFVIIAERCDCSGTSEFCVVVLQGRPVEFCKCECGFNRFAKTDFARGEIRNLKTSGGDDVFELKGIQLNEYIETLATTGKIVLEDGIAFGTTGGLQIGDYVFINSSDNSSLSGYCGQTRRVLGYKKNPTTGYYEITVDAPWLGLSATEQEGIVTFRAFSERGESLVFSACDGMYVINTNTKDLGAGLCNDEITKICDIGISASGKDTCILSISDNSGKINVLTDTGYNAYGRNGLDKFYFSTDQQNYVGKDKFLTVSYRNHLLSFGKNSIYTTVATSDIDNFTYELSENIGIWSKNAWGEFDNTFMFLASNRRLYTLSVEKDGNGYALNLQDISEPIRGMLKQIKDTDLVSIYSDSNELKIFIASTKSDTELTPTKTRIIIYDKQYKFWHEHHICQYGIQGQNKDRYYGDGYYIHCGYKDGEGGLGADGTIDIRSELTAYIGEHESLDVLPFKLYTRKWLDTIKIPLGKGTYTDNTYLQVKEDRNGFRYVKKYTGLKDIEWVKTMNLFFENGANCDEDIAMPDCYTPDECEKLNNKNLDYTNCRRDKKRDTCHCIEDFYEQEDFCNTLKDPTAHIAEVYPIKYKMEGGPSDVIEVSFISEGFDRPNIGGMIGIIKMAKLEDGDDNNEDVIGYKCCEATGLTC